MTQNFTRNSNILVVAGSGTAGKVVKFTAANTIGDSVITESSSNIGLSVASPQGKLHGIGANSVGNFMHVDGTTSGTTELTLITDAGGVSAAKAGAIALVYVASSSDTTYNAGGATWISGTTDEALFTDTDAEVWNIKSYVTGKVTIRRTNTVGGHNLRFSFWMTWI